MSHQETRNIQIHTKHINHRIIQTQTPHPVSLQTINSTPARHMSLKIDQGKTRPVTAVPLPTITIVCRTERGKVTVSRFVY
jgi:hypothetical protein